MRSGAARVALSLAGLTLAARVVGFGRSLVFSKTVGDTCLGDVYNAANSLPNALFEIVAGGVLAGVVVPVVARHVGGGRRAETARTSSALLTWTLLVLTPAGLAALAGSHLYADAFTKADCAGGTTTLAALLVMFVPQVWLYGLAVVSAGILQAHRRFLAAALAPLLSSVVVIAAYLAFARLAGPVGGTDLTGLDRRALATLGWGTTAGVLVLALATLLPLGRAGVVLRPRLRFAAGDRTVIVSIAAAGVAGLVLQQLSVQTIAWAANRTGDQGALTRFTWANAVYLLPYAVLAAPLLQMGFPRLAAAAEEGTGRLRTALADLTPLVVAASWLGAALLFATATPVARVFVLGPGSGRTAALAGPITAFVPAVVGFALLGLSSRALLALHRARPSGVATVVGWGTVIAAVLVLRLVLPAGGLVVGLGLAVSAGMVVGAVVGWVLLDREVPGAARGLAAALLRGLVAAVLAGAAGAWVGRQFGSAGLAVAVLGALAAAAVALVVFAGATGVLQRDLVSRLRTLRRPVAAAPAADVAGEGR